MSFLYFSIIIFISLASFFHRALFILSASFFFFFQSFCLISFYIILFFAFLPNSIIFFFSLCLHYSLRLYISMEIYLFINTTLFFSLTKFKYKILALAAYEYQQFRNPSLLRKFLPSNIILRTTFALLNLLPLPPSSSQSQFYLRFKLLLTRPRKKITRLYLKYIFNICVFFLVLIYFLPYFLSVQSVLCVIPIGYNFNVSSFSLRSLSPPLRPFIS